MPSPDITETESSIEGVGAGECSHCEDRAKWAFHHPGVQGLKDKRSVLGSCREAHNFDHLIKSKPSQAMDIVFGVT